MAENGTIDTRLDVHDRTIVNGIATRGAQVHADGDLIINGVLSGRLHVAPRGRAVLSGVMNGDAIIEGCLEVSGIIEGTVRATAGSDVLFAVGCIWNRRVLGRDGSWATEQGRIQPVISTSSPRFRLLPNGQLGAA